MTTVPPDPNRGQGWRKSSFSGEKQECVEVLDLPGGGREVRDSKNRAGGVQQYNENEWQAFIAGVKNGEFD